METKYFTCAETAKYVRKALKRAFPTIRFSIRSKTYSGGASINVDWTDGPTGREVETVATFYEAGGFDGMIDLAYSHYHWLAPDGTISYGGTSGTEGSRGVVSAHYEPQPIGAQLVQFGADHIPCRRCYSRGFLAAVAAKVASEYGMEPPAVNGDDGNAWLDRNSAYAGNGHETISDMVYRAIETVTA